MKYFSLLFLIPVISFSQEKFKVEYERRYFTKIEGNSEQYRLMEEVYSKPTYLELIGDSDHCTIKEIQKIDNSQGPKYQMQVVGGYQDRETYLDFKTNQKLVSREMEGKVFLVNSPINTSDWIITRETKKINGFQAKKATLVKDGVSYEVWFSTDIKSKCGPDEAFGLPGLVLEFTRIFIENPDSYATFKLENIVLNNELKFAVPTKGRAMTEAEFKKLEEEYNKRIQEQIKNQSVDRNG